MTIDEGQILGNVLQGAILLAIGGLFAQLRAIEAQLRAQNGRIGKLEEYRTAHDKQDDERHSDVKASLDRMRERTHGLAEHLQSVTLRAAFRHDDEGTPKP